MKIRSPGGNLFSLSPLGFPLYSITKNGEIWSHRRKRFLVPKIHRCRYLFVRLQHENGKWMNRYIHRLVAYMFVYTENNQLQIDHINGNKQDNNFRNLRWVTNRENAHYAMQNGRMPHAVFMFDHIVREICEALQNGESVISISKRLHFPYSAVFAIRMRRNWIHISKDYNFPSKRNRILTPDTVVHKICQLVLLGESDNDISKATSVPNELIKRIRCGVNFTRISKKYFVNSKNVCQSTREG